MACLKPISKIVKTNPFKPVYSTQVPCGKCINCLKDKQTSWMLRLCNEAKCHNVLLFITLTYADDLRNTRNSVPSFVDKDTGEVYFSVYKTHLQEWLKRFRSNFKRKSNKTFKYFFTAEYGPLSKRPHYHGLLFGVTLQEFMCAKNEWEKMYGFTVVKEIPLTSDKQIFGACKYVAKYASKGEFENPLVKEKKVLPVFRLISKGIGLKYVKDTFIYHRGFTTSSGVSRIQQIAEKSRVFFNGFYYKMPRYYKGKIYGDKSYLSTKVADFLLSANDELYRQQLSEFQMFNRCSELEAFRAFYSKEINDATYSAKNNFSSIAQFYNKSKL